MQELQNILDKVLKRVPQLALERRLSEKLKDAGVSIGKKAISNAAKHILAGKPAPYRFDGTKDDIDILITDDDIEYVVKATEKFYNEQLDEVLEKSAEDSAALLLKTLHKNWADEASAQLANMAAFRGRLERRWGKALGKLRLLLTIVKESGQSWYARAQQAHAGKLPHFDDVMLRLHVRACQVASEVIVLLENGYADGAMARWRTLHEIAIVAAIIVKFGPDIAERYVYFQIVESYKALEAYEKSHKALGFKPPTKRQAAKTRKDYANVSERFGKQFTKENGWAAHHLKVGAKERLTFERLEQEAGDAMMRSPYKMASYNVHASPKGVYFKLGSLKNSPTLLAGASNAGLTDPAQHTAVSLAEITFLMIGEKPAFDDLVIEKIVAKLEREIPLELWKADQKLRRDDKRYRKAIT
jgi:hypothetical protein